VAGVLARFDGDRGAVPVSRAASRALSGFRAARADRGDGSEETNRARREFRLDPMRYHTMVSHRANRVNSKVRLLLLTLLALCDP